MLKAYRRTHPQPGDSYWLTWDSESGQVRLYNERDEMYRQYRCGPIMFGEWVARYVRPGAWIEEHPDPDYQMDVGL